MTSSAGYMRAWRQANPDKVDRSRQVNACRKRAMTRLAAKYPAVLAVDAGRVGEGGPGGSHRGRVVMSRLFAFLRRLDDWFADRILPETVPFSPVCCPPAVRCEVAGLAVPPTARPATPPTEPTRESRADET